MSSNKKFAPVNTAGIKRNIHHQIQVVQQRGAYAGPKRALIIGGSSNYGLAARISLAFGAGAKTLNVSYEKGPSSISQGTAGYWNNHFFDQAAQAAGHPAIDILGDAFQLTTKQKVAAQLQQNGGPIDALIYSLAAPKRLLPTGTLVRSVIKPIEHSYHGTLIDIHKDVLQEVQVPPATAQEIQDTITVMGGADWQDWVQYLAQKQLLAPGFKTTFFSYIGTAATQAIYRTGTLGAAKKDAEQRARHLNQFLKDHVQGEAIITVNQAALSKASLAIPGFLLYLASLTAVQQEESSYESPIEHEDRALRQMLFGSQRNLDAQGRLRPDAGEVAESTQTAVARILQQVTPANFSELTAYPFCKRLIYQLNGF